MIDDNNNTQDNDLVGGQYKIGRMLGYGNFGEIRIGYNIVNKQMVAIKFEKKHSPSPTLYSEYKICQLFENEVGFPKVYYFGSFGKFYVLVMELLGPSLEEEFIACNKKFSLQTIIKISIQALNRIQVMHSKNYIHRDIKPENFLIGWQKEKNQNIIYLIDFGLSKLFIDPETNEHIPYREGVSLTGTARYMSVPVHLGKEQSRRDDLESLGYMFIYLLKGSLPWQGLKGADMKQKIKSISDIKVNISIDLLCQSCPTEFATYLTYVRNLNFCQKPDYDYMRKIFTNLYIKEAYTDNIDHWSIEKVEDLFESNQETSSTKAIVMKGEHIMEEVNVNKPTNEEEVLFENAVSVEPLNELNAAKTDQFNDAMDLPENEMKAFNFKNKVNKRGDFTSPKVPNEQDNLEHFSTQTGEIGFTENLNLMKSENSTSMSDDFLLK